MSKETATQGMRVISFGYRLELGTVMGLLSTQVLPKLVSRNELSSRLNVIVKGPVNPLIDAKGMLTG